MALKNLPIPPQESIVYEDEYLYICCALYPITKGHLIVVWKRDVEDLHSLSKEEYEILMRAVDRARDIQLSLLKVKKVYLIYMDEAKQVHWQLVPRYHVMGFTIFTHTAKMVKKFPLAEAFRNRFGGQL